MLDQYYTKPKIAEYVYQTFLTFCKTNRIDLSDHIFFEPSAGNGVFLKLLPEKRRFGFDVVPMNAEIKEKDYLKFDIHCNNAIVIGNPPFGKRGDMALKFLNHSKFADIVVFILPQYFISNGKGNPKKRVKDFRLTYCSNLPLDSFEYKNKIQKIATVMTIWIKNGKYSHIPEINQEIKNYDNIKIYSLSDGGTSATKRNVGLIGKCDLYVSQSVYDNIKTYENFNDLPYKRGYGIIIKENKDELIPKIKQINWDKYAFKSTNLTNNIRKELILKAIIEME